MVMLLLLMVMMTPLTLFSGNSHLIGLLSLCYRFLGPRTTHYCFRGLVSAQPNRTIVWIGRIAPIKTKVSFDSEQTEITTLNTLALAHMRSLPLVAAYNIIRFSYLLPTILVVSTVFTILQRHYTRQQQQACYFENARKLYFVVELLFDVVHIYVTTDQRPHICAVFAYSIERRGTVRLCQRQLTSTHRTHAHAKGFYSLLSRQLSAYLWYKHLPFHYIWIIIVCLLILSDLCNNHFNSDSNCNRKIGLNAHVSTRQHSTFRQYNIMLNPNPSNSAINIVEPWVDSVFGATNVECHRWKMSKKGDSIEIIMNKSSVRQQESASKKKKKIKQHANHSFSRSYQFTRRGLVWVTVDSACIFCFHQIKLDRLSRATTQHTPHTHTRIRHLFNHSTANI